LRGYQGSDLLKVNSNIRFITCPFTGEQLAAVPAIRPDAAIIHAQRADHEGNVLIEGIIGVQKEAMLGAKQAIVTVEEVVDDLRAPGPNATVMPHWTLTAVVEAPGGAWPSYAHGYYRRDNAFYTEWDTIARERDTFQKWMREHVLEGH
jgi:glutaconate CoA-transferase subunit A